MSVRPTGRNRSAALPAAPGEAAHGLLRSRRTRHLERVIEAGLFGAAVLGVATTVGIVLVLVVETVEFFGRVSPLEFATGTVWSALIEPRSFGVLPLVAGTLLVTGIALALAVPLGLLAALFLAEYAPPGVRAIVKPVLETLAGIPTIVLGFFALSFVTPALLKPLLGDAIGTFNALSAGIVVGLLVSPLIASISEDAMRAVPRSLREAGHAIGATRLEVAREIVVPAALSGIVASVVLATSRAIGETMAVYLAAGTNPRLTLDPRESVQTMTAFIVQVSLGDTPQGSTEYLSLFAVAALLFGATLGLNLLSARLVRRYRTVVA